MKIPHLFHCLPLLAPGVVAVFFTSCGRDNEYAPPPPPKVTVQKPVQQDTTFFHEVPTRTTAAQTVEVRARVRGILQSVDFEPGSQVEEGQLLFTIEPETYEAAVANAEANLAKAKAAREQAEAELQRKEQAFRTNAISEIDVLAARAQKSAADADVQSAEAALEDARIQLSYTKIHAPISGRISTNLVDAGNLVGAGDSTLLTRIVDATPIYAPFEINERFYLDFLAENPELRRQHREELYFRLKLVDGSIYPVDGELDYVDNRVNPDTGTITVQARFPNDDDRLAAGLFARVLIPEELPGSLLVPTAALQRDIGGDYLAVVGAENVVERRGIEKGPNLGGQLVVSGGLQPDDLVIVEGLQMARPGGTVDPVLREPSPPGEAEPGSAETADPAAEPSETAETPAPAAE